MVALRHQLRSPEAERKQRVRELVAASGDLCQALMQHAQYAGIICETRVARELSEETGKLYQTLARFASLIECIAAEYRALTIGDIEDDSSAPGDQIEISLQAGG
jgi:hypothetical protein